MNARIALMWAGVACLVLPMVATFGASAIDARAEASRAATRWRDTRDQIHELRTIERTLVATIPSGTHRERSIAEQIDQTLEASGLPHSMLSSLSPEVDIRSGGSGSSGSREPGIVHRRATLVLEGPTLRDVGRFLKTMSDLIPAWAATRIDLTPISTGTNSHWPSSQGGGDLPLRAVLVLERLAVPHDLETP